MESEADADSTVTSVTFNRGIHIAGALVDGNTDLTDADSSESHGRVDVVTNAKLNRSKSSQREATRSASSSQPNAPEVCESLAASLKQQHSLVNSSSLLSQQ